MHTQLYRLSACTLICSLGTFAVSRSTMEYRWLPMSVMVDLYLLNMLCFGVFVTGIVLFAVAVVSALADRLTKRFHKQPQAPADGIPSEYIWPPAPRIP